MDIQISPRGTGACPLCKKLDACHILRTIENILYREIKPVHDDKALLELVFYSCPEFEEKA